MIDVRTAAELYATSQHQEPTTAERVIFEDWLKREFDKIKYMVRFTPSEVDPTQMLIRLEETGQLLISSANSDSPWLTKKENVRFRAVHDYHHVRYGLSFDTDGEFMAFMAASAEAPKEIHWILRSEIWLQAAACSFFGGFQAQKLVRGRA